MTVLRSVQTLMGVMCVPAPLVISQKVTIADAMVCIKYVVIATLCIKLRITHADIDECSSGTDLCAHNCTNSIGSYLCSCGTGYRLNADGFQCDGKVLLLEYY